MSKADEMFFKMGYRKEIDNEDTILYKFEKESHRGSISFRKDIKTFSANTSIFVPNDAETWRTMKFETEWLKYCSAQGHWEGWHMDIGIKELQAINEKVKELKWI